MSNLDMTGSARWWNALFVVVLLGGSLFIAMTRVQPARTAGPRPSAPAPVAAPAPLPDHAAPAFALPGVDGKTVALADMRGQVVLINIWATWCPPCQAEMPMIEAAYQKYRADGFTVLAVNQGEDGARVVDFLQKHGLNFPALLDRDGAVSREYAAHALPTSFFVDRQGIIRAVYRGPLAPGVIAGTVEQLLAEGANDVPAR